MDAINKFTGNQSIPTTQTNEPDSKQGVSNSPPPEISQSNVKASQQNAVSRKAERELQGKLLQTQFQNPQITSALTQARVMVGPPLSQMTSQLQNLMKAVQPQSTFNPVMALLQQLNQMFSGANALSMAPQMEARSALRIMGTAEQAEQLLHNALSSAFGNEEMNPMSPEDIALRDTILGILAGLQGRFS